MKKTLLAVSLAVAGMSAHADDFKFDYNYVQLGYVDAKYTLSSRGQNIGSAYYKRFDTNNVFFKEMKGDGIDFAFSWELGQNVFIGLDRSTITYDTFKPSNYFNGYLAANGLAYSNSTFSKTDTGETLSRYFVGAHSEMYDKTSFYGQLYYIDARTDVYDTFTVTSGTLLMNQHTEHFDGWGAKIGVRHNFIAGLEGFASAQYDAETSNINKNLIEYEGGVRYTFPFGLYLGLSESYVRDGSSHMAATHGRIGYQF